MTDSISVDSPPPALNRIDGDAPTNVGQGIRAWFRGRNANRSANAEQMMPASTVVDHLVQGWAPDSPFIDETTRVTAFGSCFAESISTWLANRNYKVLTKAENSKAYIVSCSEGMVNTFVIRQQFEWALEGKKFEAPLWHGYKAEEYGYDEDVRQETARIFQETDFFILTLGLSEIWYDEPTGGVFWRTLPKSKYDPQRHKFRVATVEENRDNLRAIYKLIRKHRPDAKVLLTLSPIPLIATFRPESCMSANSVSKAVLRVAIDEVVREFKDDGHLFYWPSYEIVANVFQYPFKEDGRHLYSSVKEFIMMTFERVWCHQPSDDHTYLGQWLKAKSASGQLPLDVESAIKRGNLARLRRLATRPRLTRHKITDQNAREMMLAYADGEERRRSESNATAAE